MLNRTPVQLISDSSGEIARLDRPSAEEFAAFLERGEPALISGLTDDWPAHGAWTPEYLRRIAGHRRVPVKTYRPEARHFFPSFSHMTLSEYLDVHADPERRDAFRIGDLTIEYFLPELMADLRVPPLVEPGGNRASIFMGVDTFCGAHYHHYDEAILTQVAGKKRLVLYPPSEAKYLYPVPWYQPTNNWSLVNIERPNFLDHPLFRQAAGLSVTVNEGESLYIPIQWYHAAFGLDMSISVTFFWRSKLRRWHFPFPGWRALANPIRLYNALFPAVQKAGQMDRLVAFGRWIARNK